MYSLGNEGDVNEVSDKNKDIKRANMHGKEEIKRSFVDKTEGTGSSSVVLQTNETQTVFWHC